MALRFTQAAEDDLLEIFVTGLLEFGEAQAFKYRDKLKRSLDFIEDNPLGVRERPELSPSVRVHPAGAHLILYIVDGDGVLVIRIRHGREDWANDPLGD